MFQSIQWTCLSAYAVMGQESDKVNERKQARSLGTLLWQRQLHCSPLRQFPKSHRHRSLKGRCRSRPREFRSEPHSECLPGTPHHIAVMAAFSVSQARMSSAEFVEKWSLSDLGRRLGHQRASDFDLSTILVDPPRAGLDPATIQVNQFYRLKDVNVEWILVIGTVRRRALYLMQSDIPSYEHNIFA